jgi:hypothetical protein
LTAWAILALAASVPAQESSPEPAQETPAAPPVSATTADNPPAEATPSPAPAPAQTRVQPVPLGGSVPELKGDRYYGVYIPTRFGGNLTVSTTSGKVDKIIGPDGKPRSNGGEVGLDAQGWYVFNVKESEGKYAVSTKFVQVGASARKPWNYYYWPTKGDVIHEPWSGWNGRADTMYVNGDDILLVQPGSAVKPGQDIVLPGPNGLLETMPAPGDTSTWFPNLYDDLTWRGADNTLFATPSPLLKYDQLFNSSARSYESANGQTRTIDRWAGHCLGGAVASIMLNEPVPAPGSGVTADELKGLWAELGENHLNHSIGDFANDIPAGPPRPGFDPTDRFTSRVHAMLEGHIRGKRQALLSNMRAFPPNGMPNEVWNHGVGNYSATYYAIPGKGERSVRVVMDIEANTGSNLNNQDPNPRKVTYEYTIVYGLDGLVDETKAYQCDWIAVRGDALFCPLNVLEVTNSRWAGHNPYVTEANIRAIDLANGGGYGSGRFAGKAPEFRPVYAYEAGRAPFPSSENGDPRNRGLADNEGNSGPRRGFISRMFGGR